jgi:trigger factor
VDRLKVLSVETPEPTLTRLHIAIPSEEIHAELDRSFDEFRGSAQVPGFRQGKVPKNVLRARFGKALEADALQNVVPKACQEALEQRDLTVVGDATLTPTLDEMSIPESEELTFVLEVETKPPIAVPDYRVLEVDKSPVDVPREDVDRFIDALREERATYEDLDEDRPVKDDDVLYVDWSVRDPREDKVLQEREDDRVDVGSDRTWKHLSEALVGMQLADTKELVVPLQTDGQGSTGSSGPESVELKVTPKRLVRKVLAELNDEFAQSLNAQDADRLHAHVWNQLIEQKKVTRRADQERDLRDQVIERTDFEVPERVIEERRRQLVVGMYGPERRHQHDRGHQGHEDEESLTRAAERLVREEWILAEIASTENISVSEQELETFTGERGRERGEEPAEFRERIRERELEPYYRDLATERKVYEFLLDRATQKSTLIVG